MTKLPGNQPLKSTSGTILSCLRDINGLDTAEKEPIYLGLVPPRLFELLGLRPEDISGRIRVIAPTGMGLARMEVRQRPEDGHALFFLDIADTQFRQMELSFCIIEDPVAPRFDVHRDSAGNDNCFTTLGRNIEEEVRAMRVGLFPNQARRGLRMFREFFTRFELFVDSLGMDMIVAEPLTYDNAIRYEGYGFDYLSGRLMMQEIDREFRPGGRLFARLDGSSPFRMPGMERTVHGRSWAIHDGIMDEPWDGISIYKMVGSHAGLNTFPDREG